MGEIADMMIDGTMCQGCGEFLHDGEDGPGYPGWCSSCQPKGDGAPQNTGGGKRARRARKRANQRRNRLNRLLETSSSGQLDGWKKCSPYHYQKSLLGVHVDWWPSSRKCMIAKKQVYPVDSVTDIQSLIEKAKGG